MRLTILSLLLPLCVLRLSAQEPVSKEAPPWGVGILAGSETGSREKVYGSSFGGELTWQFLREHWIQGRVRATYLQVNKGSGSGGVYPDNGGPAQGEFLVGSCDWIFRFTKPHGPYLLLGAGWNHHDISAGEGNASNSRQGNFLSYAWGMGYLIQGSVEVELRQDLMVVDFFGWAGNKDATCTSLVVRKRF
jgi:hypothetical protein